MEDLNYIGAEDLPDIEGLQAEDDEPDFDTRYLRNAEIIADPKKGITDYDTHSTLSKELSGSRYQIRSPEQQAAWTEKKTNNHIMMGCFVLRLRFVMEALLEECYSPHVNKIFGQFETKKISKDKTSRRIKYETKYNAKMAKLIEAYLNKEEGAMDVVTLTETLTREYNLKYLKFIKPWCKTVIEMFDDAKAKQAAFVDARNDSNEALDLFDSTCREVRLMEQKCGLSWSKIANVVRQIRILLGIADELRSRLVCTNLRSCIFSARNYYRNFGGTKNSSFSDNDLIDEAAIGLMHAADMYVHGNSARFTTYAEEWVQLNISRHAKRNNPVLLPIHATDLANRVIRAFREREVDGRLERIPDKEEVTKDLKVTNIPESIWRVAVLRYQGYGIATNCSTTGAEDEDDTSSIDFFAQNEGDEEDTQMKMLAAKIFGFIDKMVDAKDEKIRITPLQKQFLILRYKEDYDNRDIAEKYYGTSDAKHVRAELNKAFVKLRMMLKKEQIHDIPL